MSDAKIALLPDRGVVSVTGEDARKLLAGIITNDIDLLETRPAIFAGLLSPQGKILFDFLVVKQPEGFVLPDGFVLDVAKDRSAELVKRLSLYRLRAKVEIRDESEAYFVHAMWGDDPISLVNEGYQDPRHRLLGFRLIVNKQTSVIELAAHNAGGGPATGYHAHRITLGVPEGGKDYDFGDAFPHEANFDLLHGVSFEKGCYVGQEIVARMEHRGTVRKRIARVTGTAALPADRPDVVMGDVVIGKLGSVAGSQGLALIRLDRAIEAIDKGTAVTAAGIPLVIDADMIARQRRLMAAKAGADLAPPP